MLLNVEKLLAEVVHEQQVKGVKIKAILISNRMNEHLIETKRGNYLDGSIKILSSFDLPDFGIEIIQEEK